MLSFSKQILFFLTGTALGAAVIGATLQHTTISELNHQLTEQQKQLNGLTAYNKTLQKKMLHMVKSKNAAAFYQQSFAAKRKVSSSVSYKHQ